MRSLGGEAAAAKDALMTQLGIMRRLFALIIHLFCPMNVNLEPQGGHPPLLTPTKYVYAN